MEVNALGVRYCRGHFRIWVYSEAVPSDEVTFTLRQRDTRSVKDSLSAGGESYRKGFQLLREELDSLQPSARSPGSVRGVFPPGRNPLQVRVTRTPSPDPKMFGNSKTGSPRQQGLQWVLSFGGPRCERFRSPRSRCGKPPESSMAKVIVLPYLVNLLGRGLSRA